ncbi:Enolase [Dirofilaria immitis]
MRLLLWSHFAKKISHQLIGIIDELCQDKPMYLLTGISIEECLCLCFFRGLLPHIVHWCRMKADMKHEKVIFACQLYEEVHSEIVLDLEIKPIIKMSEKANFYILSLKLKV